MEKPNTQSFIPTAITQDMLLPNVVKPRHLSALSQKGDIFYNKDGVNVGVLPIGKEGQVLKVRNGVPVWE